MKMSRTTLKELKSRYSDILKKCALLNAFFLPFLLSTNALAVNQVTSVTTDWLYDGLKNGGTLDYQSKSNGGMIDHNFSRVIDEFFVGATGWHNLNSPFIYSLYKKSGPSNFNFYGSPNFYGSVSRGYALKKDGNLPETPNAFFDITSSDDMIRSSYYEGLGAITGRGAAGAQTDGSVNFHGFYEDGIIANTVTFANNKVDVANMNHAEWKEITKDGEVVGGEFDRADTADVAIAEGGAFYNGSNSKLTSDADTTVIFMGNKALASDNRVNIKSEGESTPKSYAQGGALWNNSSVDLMGKVNFLNNQVSVLNNFSSRAYAQGGAVYNGLDGSNGGNIHFGDTVIFKNNKAVYADESNSYQLLAGGAVANQGEYLSDQNKVSMTFDKDTRFEGNVVSGAGEGYGGALYNDTSKVGFNSTSEFSGNSVSAEITAYGGAVYNVYSKLDFEDKASFKNNSVDAEYDTSAGGAVAIANSEVSFKDIEFVNNSARSDYNADTLGGALYVGDGSKVNVAGDVLMKENNVTSGEYAEGGAVANHFGELTFSGSEEKPANLVFEKNTVTSEYDGTLMDERTASRGGALSNAQGIVVFDENTNATFSENKAVSGNYFAKGGAIYNSGKMTLNGTAEFSKNTSDGDGGAIYNAKELTLAGPVSIHDNEAQWFGGAIYNSQKGVLNLNSNEITIANNKAQLGSNLFNSGEVNINNVQDSISAQAKASSHTLFDQNGDIYNEGTINIKDSNVILGGGINTIEKSKKGVINVLDSATLDVGMGEIYAHDITFDEGSTFGATLGNNSNGRLNAENITIADTDTTLKLTLGVGALAVGESKTYNVLSADNEIENNFAKIMQNNLYKIEADANNIGSYKVTRLGEGSGETTGSTEGNTGTGTDTGTGSDIGTGTGSGSSNPTPTPTPSNPYCPDGNCHVNDVNTIEAWVGGDVVTDNVDAFVIQSSLNELAQHDSLSGNKAYRQAVEALQANTTPLIRMHETENLTRLASMTEDRLSGSFDRTDYVYRGRRYGKRPNENSNVWVQGVYGKSKYSADRGWDLDTTGFAGGIDGHFDADTRLGIGYSYAKSTGDSLSRDTDIESNTGFIYGEYNPSRFYVNGLALYTTSKYNEKKKILGTSVKADYDVNAYGGQMMMGYKLGPSMTDSGWATGVLKPEIGVRYLHVDQDSYQDTIGQKVGKLSTDTVTGVVGLGYTVLYKMAPDFSIYPELKVSATYDVVEPDTDTRVVMSNGSAYKLKGDDDMKRLGAEVALRLGMDIARQAEIGLEYDGTFRGDYTNHSGMANVKYNF